MTGTNATAAVGLVGETFSANLGDGVIADSINYLASAYSPGLSIRHVDLGLRTSYNPTASSALSTSSLLKSILLRSRTVRRGATWLRWHHSLRSEARRAWEQQLGATRAVVIGGGQIIGDRDFGFPPKIREIVRIAQALGLPTAFFGCGVDKKWSRIATRYYREVFTAPNVVGISVRDDASRDSLIRHLPELNIEVQVTSDPALWASEAYGAARVPESTRGVGLGIQHPTGLQRTDPVYAAAGTYAITAFWASLAAGLVARGRRAFIFTNGSPEDHAFAREIWTALPGTTRAQVPLLDRPTTPGALVRTIVEADSVIANRLHANIVAASLGTPSVALTWDPKVVAFFAGIDRKQVCLTDVSKLSVAHVLSTLGESESTPYHATVIAARKRELRNAAAGMLSLLGVSGEATTE